MPEHRARKHHQDRVAETLRLEIGAMIVVSIFTPKPTQAQLAQFEG